MNNTRGSSFLESAVRDGHQKFFQPSTVQLPPEAIVTDKGWIQCPTSGELIIPIAELSPNANKTIYYYAERIETTSTSELEIIMEGNLTWDEQLQQFDPDAWFAQNTFILIAGQPYEMSNLFIKQVSGEAIRLKVFGATGNNNNFYFKLYAIELDWKE